MTEWLLKVRVNVRSSRDGVGLSADRIQLDADPYEIKTDIGMQSMHGKCLKILPNCTGVIALGRTSYVLAGHGTFAARVLLSRPVRTITFTTPKVDMVREHKETTCAHTIVIDSANPTLLLNSRPLQRPVRKAMRQEKRGYSREGGRRVGAG